MEIPKIWVCTAPDAAMAQTSLFMDVTAGATAVGGGDLTVVSLLELVVEFDVDSVTMACANADVAIKARIPLMIMFFIHV
jgi:hypothetical protein